MIQGGVRGAATALILHMAKSCGILISESGHSSNWAQQQLKHSLRPKGRNWCIAGTSPKEEMQQQGLGQFCQQGSVLVQAVGSSLATAVNIYSSEAYWASPLLFSWGYLPSGNLLLWLVRWSDAAKMLPTLFYVPSLVFELCWVFATSL